MNTHFHVLLRTLLQRAPLFLHCLTTDRGGRQEELRASEMPIETEKQCVQENTLKDECIFSN